MFGFLIGLPALRLEGPYLSIATLGFVLTITRVIGRIEFFGGRQGLHAPELTIGPWHLNTDRDFYYLLITLTVILTVAARNIIKTKVGRAFIAIRDADIAAETMGVNLMYYKTLAFAVSAFYTGLAGGLYAFVLRFIEPELFGLLMSILFLAMVVVGGLGSIFGAVAGACLLSWMDLELRNILSIPYVGLWLEALSKSYFSITGVSNIQFILYGLIYAFVEGAERAFVCDMSPDQIRGTALGTLHTAVGLVALPAGIVAGLLWVHIAPWTTFVYGGSMGLIAGVLLLTGMRMWPKSGPPACSPGAAPSNGE